MMNDETRTGELNSQLMLATSLGVHLKQRVPLLGQQMSEPIVRHTALGPLVRDHLLEGAKQFAASALGLFGRSRRRQRRPNGLGDRIGE